MQELGLSADKSEPGLLFRSLTMPSIFSQWCWFHLDKSNLVRPSGLKSLPTTLKERILSTKPKTQTVKPGYLVEVS